MHRDFNKQNSWQIIEKWKHDKARVRDKKCAQIECYLQKGIIFDTTWKRRKGKKRENTTWFRITQITTLNNRCHIAVFVENNKSPPKKKHHAYVSSWRSFNSGYVSVHYYYDSGISHRGLFLRYHLQHRQMYTQVIAISLSIRVMYVNHRFTKFYYGNYFLRILMPIQMQRILQTVYMCVRVIKMKNNTFHPFFRITSRISFIQNSLWIMTLNVFLL